MKNKETKGLANEDNLDYAIYNLELPRYRGDLILKAAALMFNIIRGHCFYDGNKRTALVSAATFLYFNGIELSELPLLYADYLLRVAKEAPNLKDDEVWGYIKKIANKLKKYTRKQSKDEIEATNILIKEINNIVELNKKVIK